MSDDNGQNMPPPVMANNPAHQESVNKIARAYYKAELAAAKIAGNVAELQAIVIEESRKIGVPLAYILGGTYAKDYGDDNDEGFIMPLGNAVQEANCAAYEISQSHKALTRVYCDRKIINEGGGK